MFTELVSVLKYTIGVWGAQKTDRAISNDICEQNEAEHDAGKFVKNLLGGKRPELTRITNFAQSARLKIRSISLPYDGGVLIPNTNLIPVLTLIKTLEEEFNQLVNEFLNVYPSLVTQAQNSNLFKNESYPIVDEVRSKFQFQYHLEPLPDTNSFDRSLGIDDIREKIKNDLDKEIERTFYKAENELRFRLKERIKFLKERLSTDKKINRKFLNKTQEVISDVEKLNFRKNQEVEILAKKLGDWIALDLDDPSIKQQVLRDIQYV